MADEKQNKKLFMKPPFVIITHRNSFSRTYVHADAVEKYIYIQTIAAEVVI